MSAITTNDGTDIYYKDWGSGQALVFSHGWPLSSEDLASGPFFGANRPGAKVSQGMIESFWLQGMQAGHKNTCDCIEAFSETDFTEDLNKFDVPTLIVHGDDDQIVPIDAAGRASAKIVENANLIVYSGAPHGLTDTHKDKLNADLLSFLMARDGMIPET